MRTMLLSMMAAAGLLTAIGSYAQAPAGAPAGTTGLCKDGSYYSGESKKGACAGHKGVKTWYGATAAAAPAATPAAKTAAPATAPAPPAAAPASKATPVATTAATGAHSGDVWVNTSSKVYHCPGTKYYGKTKQGEYMSEADAKSKGAHADHGKACKS